MKLAHVLTACDNNPRYTKFIPLFIESWKYLYPDIKITILFISKDSLPIECIPYESYIQRYVHPNQIIHPTFIAQVIRILWPALLNEEEGILITDMDMIPANELYYTNPIQNILSANAFISYRPQDCVPTEQIAICYNIANSPTWSSITGIKSEDDIHIFLQKYWTVDYTANRQHTTWYSDQTILYNLIKTWKVQSEHNKHIYLIDSSAGFQRFDFYHHNYNIPFFLMYYLTKQYSDAHLYGSQCTWTPDDIQQIIKGLK